MKLKRTVLGGAILLIILGVLHGVHVGTSDDVEPYLWIASAFLLLQGMMTIVLIRRRGDSR